MLIELLGGHFSRVSLCIIYVRRLPSRAIVPDVKYSAIIQRRLSKGFPRGSKTFKLKSCMSLEHVHVWWRFDAGKSVGCVAWSRSPEFVESHRLFVFSYAFSLLTGYVCET